VINDLAIELAAAQVRHDRWMATGPDPHSPLTIDVERAVITADRRLLVWQLAEGHPSFDDICAAMGIDDDVVAATIGGLLCSGHLMLDRHTLRYWQTPASVDD
jgi:hypothetical protein